MKTGGVGTKNTKNFSTMYRQTLNTEHDSEAILLFIRSQCVQITHSCSSTVLQYYLLKQQSEEEDVTTIGKLRKRCFHR